MTRVAVFAAFLVLAAQPLAAQYFGQNKVQYKNFHFQSIQTEHFDIYYYPDERGGALDAARMAERAYARLSRILHHQFQSRKPIILYASQSDFQQTNVVDATGEGLGGVTEFFKHRAVLPFTGSYGEFEHVLQHEMVHQFQYDVYSRGHAGGGVQTLVAVNPPLWFMEGMAEYLSLGPINTETAMWLRDADLETGRVRQRLVKSTQNSNYESLRFINSAGAFSPDGRFFAIAAKRKDRDDLVILDVKRGREERRIHVGLSGLQTPQWSPDGQQLVFTGFSNGFTDLYIINRDGTGLR